MIFIGIGIGIIIGAIMLTMFMKVIWHTYHGNIVETIVKIALTIAGVGIAITVVAYIIQHLG